MNARCHCRSVVCAVLFGCLLQLDQVNHQVASRVASAFTTFKQYDKERQGMMVAQLRRIAAVNGLSENVFEIVSKSLQLVDGGAAAGTTATE
jgi:aminopeptidase N